MKFLDLLSIALGNLRRQKLRSLLSITGVVVAIAAFVCMLSFGAGNQRLIADQFDELGLFTTMLVYPAEGEEGDSLALLDAAAVEKLAEIPGVRLAYPYDRFTVQVSWGDSTITTSAQALPSGALSAAAFSRRLAGEPLARGEDEVVVTEALLEDFGVEDPDSAIGQSLVVSVRSASADSGLVRVMQGSAGRLRENLAAEGLSELFNEGFAESILRGELSQGARDFFDGFLNAQAVIADTLRICGVIEGHRGRQNVLPMILPEDTARRFDAAGPGGDPTQLLPLLMSGQFFGEAAEPAEGKSFSQVTLDLTQTASHPAVADSVGALGFTSFSYASEFQQIRRVMLFFNMGLGLVGFVALFTAALGIANTLIMSISERRREIGILRSLGAEPRDIGGLFLVESGTIGALGAAGGLLLGWGVARLLSLIAREVMRRQEVDAMELFTTPLWLVGLALGFGILVAVLAGSYPARRASRLDPVQALREE